MISVTQAEEIVNAQIVDFGTERLPLSECIGKVLKEDWHTDRDLPPYDRVTMDGIAICYATFAEGIRSFPIQGVAAAGDPQMAIKAPTNCLEVMTGSIMPTGLDSVIRYEDITIHNHVATVNIDKIRERQNIHFQGEDKKSGDLIVKKDTIISPAEIGVGASIGKSTITVGNVPRVMVISTGDELVEIDQQPLQHQIRRSNVYRLSTTLRSYGIIADTDHILDDKKEIAVKLKSHLENYDVIILSGGVSKGKFDYLPEVLSELGVTKLFHKIAQRPGKPFWFGKYQKSSTIFALPGNPVSSFLCMQRYFVPWLRNSLGVLHSMSYAILQEDVHFKPNLTYFLEVSLAYSTEGKILATPKKGNGSGDLANLTTADAFIELPQEKEHYHKGEIFPFYRYR